MSATLPALTACRLPIPRSPAKALPARCAQLAVQAALLASALLARSVGAQAPESAPKASREPAAQESLDQEEPPSTGARVELALLSAPFGAGAGLLLCGVAECADARGMAGSMLGGAAAGVLISTLATRGPGVAFPTAQAIEGGAFWGTATPVYLWLLASNDSYNPRGLFAGMAAGELLGAGLGGLVERAVRPTSGAVALANSGALWLSAITALLTFAIDLELQSDAAVRGLAGGLLAAQLIGLSAGGLIGQRFGTRRVQVWLADVGGVLLGGTMPLLTWLIGGDRASPEAMLGSTAAGMALGFAGAYLLTEFLPRRKQVVTERSAGRLLGRTRIGLMPLPRGGGLSLSASL